MDTPRRRQVADAALQVLAHEGSRGLTHRAVDRAAGLPAGSTSYYHRSRASLLGACVQRLLEHDESELDRLEHLDGTTDASALAEVLGGLLERWLTVDRYRHVARYELTMESLRRPDIASELQVAGQRLRERVADLLAGLGADEPLRQARTLVACIDGLLFTHLAGADAARPLDRAELRAAVHGLLDAALAPRRPASPDRREV
jgi:DNA-binding transcriptional regulator YbjK